jgi:hypothetical protein
MASSTKDPEILHLSFRESDPDNECPWLYVNVVFRVFEEHDIMSCKTHSEDWVRSVLFEVDDPKAIDLYYLNTKFKFEPIENSELSRLDRFIVDPEYDISHLKRSGWESNPYNFLQYKEKFDVFVFREYVEDNEITRSALKILNDLKQGEKVSKRFVAFSTLIRTLSTLNTFWD